MRERTFFLDESNIRRLLVTIGLFGLTVFLALHGVQRNQPVAAFLLALVGAACWMLSRPAHKQLYPGIKKLTRKCIRQLEAAEQKLLDRALFAVYSAEWAAAAARDFYNVDPSKIVAIPWGANIHCSRTEKNIDQYVFERSNSERFQILFSGVDWERKGGSIVLEACSLLVKQGVPVDLHVLGCMPPCPVPDWVTVHGFVSKNSKAGIEMMNRLYETSHLLFVPSRAEAYGIVFAEASSYGLPSVTTAVGGIPGVVREGLNGHLLPLSAGSSIYAEKILSLWRDKTVYKKLAETSFREYSTRLNWKCFGIRVIDLIREKTDAINNRN